MLNSFVEVFATLSVSACETANIYSEKRCALIKKRKNTKTRKQIALEMLPVII